MSDESMIKNCWKFGLVVTNIRSVNNKYSSVEYTTDKYYRTKLWTFKQFSLPSVIRRIFLLLMAVTQCRKQNYFIYKLMI